MVLGADHSLRGRYRGPELLELFRAGPLEERLRKAGVEDLIVAGVMTNCCCETTARDAFGRDFRVFFASDATAAADEELHEASLKNLSYAFAYVMSVRGLARQLKA